MVPRRKGLINNTCAKKCTLASTTVLASRLALDCPLPSPIIRHLPARQQHYTDPTGWSGLTVGPPRKPLRGNSCHSSCRLITSPGVKGPMQTEANDSLVSRSENCPGKQLMSPTSLPSGQPTLEHTAAGRINVPKV